METNTRRAELIAELVTVQNHEAHFNRDIMTITGFMDLAQVEKHLASCRQQAGIAPMVSVCSWCPDARERTLVAMAAGHEVTHTICAACIPTFTAAAERCL